MTATGDPRDLVLDLVRVINGEVPRRWADHYLDPNVRIHMDVANHMGITLWYKWIHLIRHRGRIDKLRMAPQTMSCDPRIPGMVVLSMRWAGVDRAGGSPVLTPEVYHLRYLVRDGRIVEIWTHKINYEAIFGSLFSRSLYYRVFLGWAALYFASLSLRGLDYRID